jgi:hypothetical protein
VLYRELGENPTSGAVRDFFWDACDSEESCDDPIVSPNLFINAGRHLRTNRAVPPKER